MSRVSQAQMVKLLDLLSEDGVLVHGKVMYTNTNRQNFWKRIALQLNSVGGGGYKNTWKWCKMWADWKNKTKKKADILLRKKNYSFTQQTPTLTNLELRLLKMIDYPIDEKGERLKMRNKNEMPDNTTDEMPDNTTDEMPVDFLAEDYSDLPCNIDKISSDEEDNTILGYFIRNKSKPCNGDGDDYKSEVFEESSDIDKKLKMKDKKSKKRKISLEEFKIRTTLALEKERAQQKSEELRLRALELKLKGEELKLKEFEMNKINYLTNIEEEKLKCFREISLSLKELLDRTRNGNPRFHNVI